MSTVEDLIETLAYEASLDLSPADTPDVGIVMGSDSDLDVMRGAATALEELGFSEQSSFENPPADRFTYETFVISAHRTPDLMYSYASAAMDRGIEIIIAGAGGKSADLPNMTASIAYPLPVIGVPVQEKSVDSVIGMPTGAPIVAVDAGKSFNAGLSAGQFLSLAHPPLQQALEAYHENLQEQVGVASLRLHEEGIEKYVKNHEC